MPAEKKKRKYTFRKGQVIPYESGSLIHQEIKAQRRTAREMKRAFGTKNQKKSRKK